MTAEGLALKRSEIDDTIEYVDSDARPRTDCGRQRPRLARRAHNPSHRAERPTDGARSPDGRAIYSEGGTKRSNGRDLSFNGRASCPEHGAGNRGCRATWPAG